ncbi:hypothetical protein BD413DRAFT_448964, partial [Trametes elegans]
MAQTTTTSTPIALFKNPDEGDLTLRTSDQVDFFVHRRRLADVSSVFADLFSFPQPAIEGKVVDERPVVDVSEKSGVWEWLLPYIYIAEEPNIALGQIYDLLEAARKYQMMGVRSRLKIHLMRSDFLDEGPYTVYALACVGGFEDVARLAARRTLRLPVYPEDAPEFAHVSGRAIVRLLDYRRRCSDATRALFDIGTGSHR